MFKTSKESLEIVQNISDTMEGNTFHHHYHILLDIANSYPKDYKLTYLEIGAYAGGSACLMMYRPNTDIFSIDLGKPIHPQIVYNNVLKHNQYGNNYNYIEGNSNDHYIINRIQHLQVDILFIDGDHSYLGVWKDYINYSNLVKPNGYIVFDDYNDYDKSPMVKSAVDHITNQLRNDYEIIGTLKNIYKARGLENTDQLGNCFVIRKLDKEPGYSIPIAIVIPTYRKDDLTIVRLEKTLDSVFHQTYKNYKLFLIGDDYSHPEEIYKLLEKYPTEKVYFKNLPFSRERKYHPNKSTLWLYGGVNAVNTGIDIALENGYEYQAHLDHDDIWHNDHLQEIAKGIEITGADFICTQGLHVDGRYLPFIFTTSEKYVQFYPMYNAIIHSTVCMNFNKIPLRYKDLYLDKGVANFPADGEMWERTRKHILKNNLRSFCVNKVTVLHDTENT